MQQYYAILSVNKKVKSKWQQDFLTIFFRMKYSEFESNKYLKDVISFFLYLSLSFSESNVL